MAKMHGEHKRDFAARQMADIGKREVNKEHKENSKPDSIEIPVLCTCRERYYPHYHSFYERMRMVKEWNQVMKRKIRLPVKEPWETR